MNPLQGTAETEITRKQLRDLEIMLKVTRKHGNPDVMTPPFPINAWSIVYGKQRENSCTPLVEFELHPPKRF